MLSGWAARSPALVREFPLGFVGFRLRKFKLMHALVVFECRKFTRVPVSWTESLTTWYCSGKFYLSLIDAFACSVVAGWTHCCSLCNHTFFFQNIAMQPCLNQGLCKIGIVCGCFPGARSLKVWSEVIWNFMDLCQNHSFCHRLEIVYFVIPFWELKIETIRHWYVVWKVFLLATAPCVEGTIW